MLAVASGAQFHSWLDVVPGFQALQESLSRSLPLSFLKQQPAGHIVHVVLTMLVLAIIVTLTVKAKNRWEARTDAKLTARTFIELIMDALLGLMSDLMGRKQAERFLPLIGTLALFIFFCNVLALVPGFLPPTDNLNTTAAPAIVVFITTHVVGVREHGFMKYFGHFLGPIHKWYAFPLMMIMLPIELIGHLARPVSLSLRLLGNMFGDHAVLGVFLGMFPFLLPLPIMGLGVVVVVVQTAVFCLLSIIYISMAVAHADH